MKGKFKITVYELSLLFISPSFLIKLVKMYGHHQTKYSRKQRFASLILIIMVLFSLYSSIPPLFISFHSYIPPI